MSKAMVHHDPPTLSAYEARMTSRCVVYETWEKPRCDGLTVVYNASGATRVRKRARDQTRGHAIHCASPSCHLGRFSFHGIDTRI